MGDAAHPQIPPGFRPPFSMTTPRSESSTTAASKSLDGKVAEVLRLSRKQDAPQGAGFDSQVIRGEPVGEGPALAANQLTPNGAGPTPVLSACHRPVYIRPETIADARAVWDGTIGSTLDVLQHLSAIRQVAGLPAIAEIGLSAEGLRVLTARQGLPEGDVVLVYLASGPTRVVLA